MLQLKNLIKNTKLFKLMEASTYFRRYCFIRWRYSLNKQYYHSGCEEPKFIAMIDGRLRHGGLADRIRNVIGVYYHCKKYQVTFKLNWVYPFTLDMFLCPNKVDWRVSPDEISYDKRISSPKVYYAYWVENKFGKKTEKETHKLFSSLKPQTHFYGYLHTPHEEYAPLFSELFKPSPQLKAEVDSYISQIGGGLHKHELPFPKPVR